MRAGAAVTEAGPALAASPARHVIGHGTPAGCTSAAVVAAVRAGGIIRFACGPRPIVIAMRATAKVMNASRQVVLDGGGLVTLSGEGRRRILYMDTCDPAQVWTTSHCQDQAAPQLVVQNLTLADGNSTGQRFDGGGGGAIFARGGQLRIVNSVFSGNRCERDGPDIGGGAVRALSQYRGRPVSVVNSTFTANVVQQRRRPEQHRRLLDGAQQSLHSPTARSASGPTRPGRAPRAAAAAARSTTTATGCR